MTVTEHGFARTPEDFAQLVRAFEFLISRRAARRRGNGHPTAHVAPPQGVMDACTSTEGATVPDRSSLRAPGLRSGVRRSHLGTSRLCVSTRRPVWLRV